MKQCQCEEQEVGRSMWMKLEMFLYEGNIPLCWEEFSLIYPEDTSIVKRTFQIKLPQPISQGGTDKSVLKISFDFDFSSFSNIK